MLPLRLIVLRALLMVIAAVQPASAAGFDAQLAGRVFAAAFAFTVPRTLDQVCAADLGFWGLQGMAALDPALKFDRPGRIFRLAVGGQVVFSRAQPAAEDYDAWGSMTADMAAHAFAASATLRRAGAQALLQAFFDEVFGHLDPYSRYVPPTPAAAERDQLSLDAAAGATLIRRHGGVVVEKLIPGGPAHAAGIRVGDRILAINHIRVDGMSAEKAAARLTGAEGTQVDLRLRGLDHTRRDVTLTLTYVPPRTVFADRDGNLLVLRITAFDGNTAELLSEALETAQTLHPPPAAIVLDLRGNRGGLLRQAVTSVALLAEQGVIASTAGRNPQATHDWRIDGGGDLTLGARLIVLVDGRTASAAEIMAAALADLGRAVVVGSATLGKGLVQTITKLPDGGELFVTWSRVLAPRAWPLQGLGVIPQVCTSLGPAETLRELHDLAAGRFDMDSAVANSRTARAPLTPAKILALRAPCPAADAQAADTHDMDLMAAHYLADHKPAYAAALIR